MLTRYIYKAEGFKIGYIYIDEFRHTVIFEFYYSRYVIRDQINSAVLSSSIFIPIFNKDVTVKILNIQKLKNRKRYCNLKNKNIVQVSKSV